jgi:hypothetical protein
MEVAITAIAVVVALAATGTDSARLGRAPIGRAALRTMAGGIIAMSISYGIGASIAVECSGFAAFVASGCVSAASNIGQVPALAR